MLNEKNKSYMERLDREETKKKKQLAILRKTYENTMQEKEMLIAQLEAVIDEQESKLNGMKNKCCRIHVKKTIGWMIEKNEKQK